MKHFNSPNYKIELLNPSRRRMADLIHPGDFVYAFVHHRGGGFCATLRVTAVHPWGVFAVIRGEEAKKLSRHYVKEFYESLIKRQFKVKWPNMFQVICAAADPDTRFVSKPDSRQPQDNNTRLQELEAEVNALKKELEEKILNLPTSTTCSKNNSKTISTCSIGSKK